MAAIPHSLLRDTSMGLTMRYLMSQEHRAELWQKMGKPKPSANTPNPFLSHPGRLHGWVWLFPRHAEMHQVHPPGWLG